MIVAFVQILIKGFSLQVRVRSQSRAWYFREVDIWFKKMIKKMITSRANRGTISPYASSIISGSGSSESWHRARSE
ncbi:hypothetical protein L6452_06151 [Arctium lappa]|uniref:Uncharacterized protein n=1 Tax=Arctium lappa TaxID=4217 RepID=A0ACB9EI33_ARCLA|nr:hypothetical protein L6452_06151 [Arctium lappa]